MGNKQNLPKNDMEVYYNSTMGPLKKIINYQKNKSVTIIDIITKTQSEYDLYNNKIQDKSITIKYNNNEIYDISCDSIETGVIMFYFNIDNPQYTNNIDIHFKKYIKKTIQKN
jgi:hypothetical protein